MPNFAVRTILKFTSDFSRVLMLMFSDSDPGYKRLDLFVSLASVVRKCCATLDDSIYMISHAIFLFRCRTKSIIQQMPSRFLMRCTCMCYIEFHVLSTVERTPLNTENISIFLEDGIHGILSFYETERCQSFFQM